jgi:hypothetical protein
MSNMLMLTQMGLSIAGGVTDAMAIGAQNHAMKMDEKSREATRKAAAAVQAYRNTMNALDAAQKLNTVSQNEVIIRDGSVALDGDIQAQALRDQGSGEVAAAAAGVKGNSVNLTMRELARSSTVAQKNRLDNLKASYAASATDRKNINLARIMGKDISVIPPISPASRALGIGSSILSTGAQLIDIWDSHQTPGNTTSDTLSRL